MLVNDMINNESKHAITMIPEEARSTDIIRDFTPEERRRYAGLLSEEASE